MHMISTKSKFAALNLNKDLQKTIEELSKKFPKLSDKEKMALVKSKLQLTDYKKKKHQTVKIDRLIEPFSFYRLDEKDDHTDLDLIENLEPVRVVAIPKSDMLLVTSGSRRLRYYEEFEDIDVVDVEIVGEAKCFSQISAARAIEMTKITKPLSNFELALGLHELREDLISEFGEDAFYKHGGTGRKGKSPKKASVIDYIANLLGIKKWAVQALLRFASQLGPLALKGLHNRKESGDLSVRKIQRLNGKIDKKEVRRELELRLDGLDEDSATEEAVSSAGDVAYQLLMKLKEEEVEGDGDEIDPSETEELEVDLSEVEEPTEDSDEEEDDIEDDSDGEEDDIEDMEPLCAKPVDAKNCLDEHIAACERMVKLLANKSDTSKVNLKKLKEGKEKANKTWLGFNTCYDEVFGD